MRIEVIPFASAINTTSIKDKTVIVIDVLRATSVMITALQNGAREIIPVTSIAHAKKKAALFPPGKALLCGERDAIKINGFDLGNSPIEYHTEIVDNKSIILTTTNGTRALNSCRDAKEVLIGSFLNVEVIVQKVKPLDELVLVCSGTNGKFSLDDGMCAATIMHEISINTSISSDDLGHVLLNTWRNKKEDVHHLLAGCKHVSYLIKKGYKEDVSYCLQTNRSMLVPVFDNRLGNVKIM